MILYIFFINFVKLFLNIYHHIYNLYQFGCILTNKLAKTKDKMAINFIKIFKLGPLVSFNGSPTVSPTTAALCKSLPFLTTLPKIKILLYLDHLSYFHLRYIF
jgi:hypothetical protein